MRDWLLRSSSIAFFARDAISLPYASHCGRGEGRWAERHGRGSSASSQDGSAFCGLGAFHRTETRRLSSAVIKDIRNGQFPHRPRNAAQWLISAPYQLKLFQSEEDRTQHDAASTLISGHPQVPAGRRWRLGQKGHMRRAILASSCMSWFVSTVGRNPLALKGAAGCQSCYTATCMLAPSGIGLACWYRCSRRTHQKT